MCDYNSRSPRWMPPAPAITISPRDRFAHEHGLTEAGVREMCYLASNIAVCGEHECNGTPHHRANDPTDKNECATLWGEDRDASIGRLEDLATPLHITVWVNGLRPSLCNAAGTFLEIPQ